MKGLITRFLYAVFYCISRMPLHGLEVTQYYGRDEIFPTFDIFNNSFQYMSSSNIIILKYSDFFHQTDVSRDENSA